MSFPTVMNDFQVSKTSPSVVGGIETGVWHIFPRPSLIVPNGAWFGGGSLRPVSPSIVVAYGALALQGAGTMNGQFFQVIAEGTCTSPESITANIEIMSNTGTWDQPTYTVIGTTGDFEMNPGVENDWSVTLGLYGDGDGDSDGDEYSGSGLLGGYQVVTINGTTGSVANVTQVLSGINFGYNNTVFGGIPSGPPVSFVARIIFGTSNAGNSASLTKFRIQSLF
jgi:hypothetical protein